MSRRTLEGETQEDQLPGANEAPSVKRLDGEVTKLGEIAFAGGANCEIWVGRWKKGGEGVGGEKVDGEKVDGEKVDGDGDGDGEKVCLSVTTSIPLTRFFIGSLENTSDTQVTGEGAQGSTLLTIPTLLTQPSFPVIRDSKANCHIGQSCTTKTSCRSMVCIFPELSSGKVPMVV